MRRTVTTTAVALALVLAGSLMVSTPAGASAGDEAWFVQQINSHRAARGLAPLQVDGALAASARSWSEHMSRTGLAHDPNIGSAVSGWTRIGENVGYGQSRDQVLQAFLNSSQHRGNYEQGAYTHVGVGVVISGGNLWVTQRFMQVAGASAPAPAPAPPAPVVVTPAPAPSPQVVPAPAPPRNGPAAPSGGSGAGSGGEGSAAVDTTTSTTAPSPASVERVSLMIDALHALG